MSGQTASRPNLCAVLVIRPILRQPWPTTASTILAGISSKDSASEVDLLAKGRGGHAASYVVATGKRSRPSAWSHAWLAMHRPRLSPKLASGSCNCFGRLSKMASWSAGRPCSRAYLSMDQAMGVLAVGGLRVVPYDSLAGLLLGKDPNLARTQARPVATRATLIAWVEEEARALGELGLPLSARWTRLRMVAACGGDTATLPICVSHEGPLDAAGLQHWAAEHTDGPVISSIRRKPRTSVTSPRRAYRPPTTSCWSTPIPWRPAGGSAAGDDTGGTLQARCRAILHDAWGGLKECPRLCGAHGTRLPRGCRLRLLRGAASAAR